MAMGAWGSCEVVKIISMRWMHHEALEGAPSTRMIALCVVRASKANGVMRLMTHDLTPAGSEPQSHKF